MTHRRMVLQLPTTPFVSDTVIVPAGGYVVIDFIATNPGHWFMHCHVDHHLQTGMAMEIREVRAMQTDPPEDMKEPTKDFCWNVEDFERKIHEVKPPIKNEIVPRKVVFARKFEPTSILSKVRAEEAFKKKLDLLKNPATLRSVQEVGQKKDQAVEYLNILLEFERSLM